MAENSNFTPFNQPGYVLELFKRNHLFNSLLLLPYALVIRSVVILFPDARVPGEIYGGWGGEILTAIQQWGAGAYLLSTILVFIQAAILNRLFIRQSMTGEINLFPGLAYIVLTSLHPAFISFSSVLLANTTLLIGLGYLFDVLKKERQEENRFMVGLWFAVTGLLFTPYFVLLLFGLISMSMLKTLKLRDIFQYLTGYVSPFLIGWLIRIILTDYPWPAFFNMFDSFGLPVIGPFSRISDIIAISVMGLLLFISILGYTQIQARKNIHAQKKIDTLYSLIFFSLVMTLFPEVITIEFLMVLMIPFSLFMAVLLRLIRHPAAAESIHFILFVAAVISQVLFLV
jgi:hypothetical protein